MRNTLVSRLLDAADALLEGGPRSSAFRRRAVSTAYYAVFHALAKTCADRFLPIDRDAKAYERVYRALDHGPLKSTSERERNDLLKGRQDVLDLLDLVVLLHGERERADYLPPVRNVFSYDRAKELIGQARIAVKIVESLSDADRDALAVCLIFKAPPKERRPSARWAAARGTSAPGARPR